MDGWRLEVWYEAQCKKQAKKSWMLAEVVSNRKKGARRGRQCGRYNGKQVFSTDKNIRIVGGLVSSKKGRARIGMMEGMQSRQQGKKSYTVKWEGRKPPCPLT